MASASASGELGFEDPAIYRIVVPGVLHPCWHYLFGGFRISTSHAERTAPETALVGCVRNQEELHDMLDLLYGLSVPVGRVESHTVAVEMKDVKQTSRRNAGPGAGGTSLVPCQEEVDRR